MRNNFKRLIASTFACGMIFSISASALNPAIEREFESTFGGRVILHEDFRDPTKFPMADADQIIEKMTNLFQKYPNIAEKLTSRKPLIIKPFEIGGTHCANAPEDSVELCTGIFRYKADEDANYLFIDVFDTHLPLSLMPDPKESYNLLMRSELIALLINTVIYARHLSEFKTPNQPTPDRYFADIKNEIINLARTKYEYMGVGNLLGGVSFNVGDREISDSTITSKEWVLGLISDTLSKEPNLNPALCSAADEWLRQQ